MTINSSSSIIIIIMMIIITTITITITITITSIVAYHPFMRLRPTGPGAGRPGRGTPRDPRPWQPPAVSSAPHPQAGNLRGCL